MNQDFYLNKALFIDFKKTDINQDYEFIKNVGKGAYGVVYLVRQRGGAKKTRAVKVLPKAKVKFPLTFFNEMEILKKLDHPNIIKIYQTFEDEQNFYIVTDYCEGGELYDRLVKIGSFNEEKAREIFKQILYAINYCHHCQITHRDLKPENFLLLDNETLSLKIIDFGLSFAWKESIKEEMMAKKENRLIGTSYYVAPQVIRGDYDEKCDIWSLGVILYILLTGVPPFDGETDKQILLRVKEATYTFNIPEMKNISMEAKDLIFKILKKDSERITIEQIYKHPWMNRQLLKTPLRINFGKIMNFTKFSKLKTYAVTCIASQLSGKDLEKMSQLFRQIDTNHDGFIETSELKQALQKQKQNINLSELNRLIDFVDTDHNGKINYSEFIACCMDNSIIFKEENLIKVFQTLDQNNDGFIEVKELKQALRKSEEGQHLNQEVLQEIFNSCDKNKDGMIDFKEFLASISQLY